MIRGIESSAWELRLITNNKLENGNKSQCICRNSEDNILVKDFFLFTFRHDEKVRAMLLQKIPMDSE